MVFRLTRRTKLRITIMRVYPSCQRVGSFTIGVHRGVNRIRFRGRMHGRPLPEGGYRLIVRARGAERDAAAIPIVIANGKTSTVELRKARRTTLCSAPVAELTAETAKSAAVPVDSASDNKGSGGGALTAIKGRVETPLGNAAEVIEKQAKGVSEGLKDAATSPFDDPFVLTLVALMALSSALLGAFVLGHVMRATGIRNRLLR